jgi:hypothetical protein
VTKINGVATSENEEKKKKGGVEEHGYRVLYKDKP